MLNEIPRFTYAIVKSETAILYKISRDEFF